MKGEKLVQGYVDAVLERRSYEPIPGEEQTPARETKLKIARASEKWAYSKLNGSMLGEARRRLAAFVRPCRPGLSHAKPCAKIGDGFKCECGCAGDDTYCMAGS